MDNQLLLLDISAMKLSAEEELHVREMLSNPTVQKYFKVLHFNAMLDVNQNDANTKEEEIIFLSRYKRFLGVQQICALVGSFAKKG